MSPSLTLLPRLRMKDRTLSIQRPRPHGRYNLSRVFQPLAQAPLPHRSRRPQQVLKTLHISEIGGPDSLDLPGEGRAIAQKAIAVLTVTTFLYVGVAPFLET